MMRFKVVLFVIFCSVALKSESQIWVDDNAVWHYDFWNIAAGVGFYTIERDGDSILGGQLCERYVVTTTRFWYFTQPPGQGPDTLIFDGSYFYDEQYLYTSGDTVFRWDGNTFRTLFNFNAQVGESWMISALPNPLDPSCTDSTYATVTNIGIQTIGGNNYRYITLSTPWDAAWQLNGTFNERFGGDYIFPYYGDSPCNNGIWELDILSFKCFEDDNFSLYNPSGEDCEYYLTHLGTSDLSHETVTLYPNPAYNEVVISGVEIESVIVYNAFGQKLEGTILEENALDISVLNEGTYILLIQSQSGFKAVRKLLIQR